MAQATNPTTNPDIEDVIDQVDFEDLELEPIASAVPAEDSSQNLDLVSVKREDTRGRLALAFIAGFFVILVIGMLIAALNEGDKVDSTKEILLTISGILSGPLGFVVGYYFRSREEN